MADALCGPSNPVQNFQKHASANRTLQQDRLIARQSPLQGFRTPNPNAGILDAEFEAFQAGQPIIPEPFQHQQTWHNQPTSSFQASSSQQYAPNWASDFQNLHIHDARATPIPVTQFRSEAPLQRTSPTSWHQDFMKQGEPQGSQYQQVRPVGGNLGFAMTANNSSAYRLDDDIVSAPRQNFKTQVNDVYDEEAFQKAFEAADSELQGHEASTQQMDVVERPQLPESSNMPEDRIDYRIGSDRIFEESQQRQESQSKEQEADELARTAGQLLENVKHEQSAKFQESNFLSLMRQLRDKDVRIEGDNFVDVEQPLHPGGPGYPNSREGLPAGEEVERPRPSLGKARASSVPPRRHYDVGGSKISIDHRGGFDFDSFY
ncbi:MAG: hypothetical protein Q9181_005528 [Wetmoreana brouardii]